MKTYRIETSDIQIIAGTFVCCFFCGALIAFSFEHQTITFTTLILLLLGIVAGLWYVYFSRQKKKQSSVDELIAAQVKVKTEKTYREYNQELSKKVTEIEKLKLALQSFEAGGIRKSAEQELQELKKFYNNFPLTLADGYVINGLQRTEFVPNSHSRWKVYGENGGRLFTAEILRPDVQKKNEMLMMIKGTKSCEELPELNLAANQFVQ